MKFTQHHQYIFEKLSYDRSPIHWDKAYAHRTPIADIVVYGIASVIYGLGLWAKGRSFSLRKINGQFRRALYIDVEYDFLIDEKDNKVTIKVARKNSILMEYSFEWGLWERPQLPAPSQIETDFVALEHAKTDTTMPGDISHIDYHCNEKVLKEFNHAYSLDYRQLPFEQFLSLLWSSYQVGMVWPGAQALYISFDFRFSTSETCTLTLHLNELQFKRDDRFDMADIVGLGEEFKLKMTAFFRPRPIDYGLDAIADEVKADETLAGKNILVLGASRGFGSVLSRAFLLKGANVAINYRTDGNEITDLSKQLSHFNNRVFFVKGDISNQVDCEVLNASIEQYLGGLDYLVCNASPQIMAFPFQEMNTEEFIDFVARSISVSHRPLHSLMPLLNEGATVIIISSIYASQPTKQFSHYVTAKWSLEGMAYALACEFPDLNFVVARLPRMLTDQTNSNFDFEKKVSAISVASRLLDKVLQSDINERPLIINF